MTTVTQAQIDAATDPIALQKLQARIQMEQANAYDAELLAVKAEREAAAAARAEAQRHNQALEAIFSRQANAAEGMFLAFRQQATGFDASERGELTRKVFDQLVPVYMKPSTATTADGRLLDVNADADFLLKAVQKVMGAYDGLRAPQ